jgi:cobalamin biosynthetic protein CobC
VTPGASALLARIIALVPAATVAFPGPTCNQHAAAFSAHGWRITGPGGNAAVAVHPNSAGSRLWPVAELSARLTVADDSVSDVASSASHVNLSVRPGTLIVRRIGRFRRVLGVRLGLVIGGPSQIAKLANWLGALPVSGPVQAPGSAL